MLTEEDIRKVDGLLFNRQLASREFNPVTVLVDQPATSLNLGETAQDVMAGAVAGGTLEDVGTKKIVLFGVDSLISFGTVSAQESIKLRLRHTPGLHFATFAQLGPDGEIGSSRQMFAARSKAGRWRELFDRRNYRDAWVGLERAYQFVVFAALAKRYHWTVRLRVDDGPVLQFMTSSEEARAIFRWRDKPPDMKRRPALRHWVTSLNRSKKAREPWYLRGAVDFVWEGISCKIIPSDFDREIEVQRKAE